ncbi:hypothetical protein PMAYCL1PPCAC_12877, partial [Pristionchus mayeri]
SIHSSSLPSSFSVDGMEEGSNPSPLLNMDQSQLDSLLQSLLSSDTQQRLSDGSLDQLPPEQQANLLLKIGQSSANEETRCSSLDRLSRLLSSILHSWCSNELVPFTAQMIQFAFVDKNPKLRDKIDDVLVLLTKHSLELNSGVHASPMITSFVHQCAAASDSILQRSSIAIITGVPSLFGKVISDLRDVVEKCMLSTDLSIRLLALSSFFDLFSDKTLSALTPLLPVAIQICGEFVTASEEIRSKTPSPINRLTQLASKYPDPMRGHLKRVITLCGRVS